MRLLVGISSLIGIRLACTAISLGLSAIWGNGVFVMWTQQGVGLGILSGVIAPWAWIVGVIHLV